MKVSKQQAAKNLLQIMNDYEFVSKNIYAFFKQHINIFKHCNYITDENNNIMYFGKHINSFQHVNDINEYIKSHSDKPIAAYLHYTHDATRWQLINKSTYYEFHVYIQEKYKQSMQFVIANAFAMAHEDKPWKPCNNFYVQGIPIRDLAKAAIEKSR